MAERIFLDWFDLKGNLTLILDVSFVKRLAALIRSRYVQTAFDKKVGTIGLYARFRDANPRIKVWQLKRVLAELQIDFAEAPEYILFLGRNKSLKMQFPYKISPLWGQLLGHAFFDGYADEHILRYSNYDLGLRKEFSTIAKKVGFAKMNVPQNYLRDIDLPETAPKLLCSIFGVETFYSGKCRIPKKFFKIVEKDEAFGWHFLRAAFLDEGTITSGQIWIVRGIVNEKLVGDLVLLCKQMGLASRVQETTKGRSHSVGITSDSFERFYSGICNISKSRTKKIVRLQKKLLLHREAKKKISKVRLDCEDILDYLERHRSIRNPQVRELCGVSDLAAFFRLKLLVDIGNIKRVGSCRRQIYYVLSSKCLPEVFPKINDVRRSNGWR